MLADKLVSLLEGRSSKELKDQLLSMGLSPEGMSTDQMEQALASALWVRNHPNEEMPPQIDAMLAHDATKAGREWVRANFSSKSHYIEEKKDGMRSIFRLEGSTVHMTSRSRSVDDFLFIPHHDFVLGFKGLRNPFKGRTVFDGELLAPEAVIDTGKTITATKLQAVVALTHMTVDQSLKIQQKYGSLQYHAFDILWAEGVDVQKEPFEVRLKLRDSAIQMLKHANPEAPIYGVETITDYKDAWDVFQAFLAKGAEGVMMKERRAPYLQGKRVKSILKLKGAITIDGFITGFVPASEGKGFAGQIGGFQISAYVDGREKVIASVSNITNDVRKDATLLVDGKPTLNPKYLNRCVELIGQQWSKNGLLGSARINEWRDDKTPSQCKLDSKDMVPDVR